MRSYFMTSERIGFSCWGEEDLPLATRLWGDPAVTRWICASGRFSEEEISARLSLEMRNRAQFGIQYWPIFDRLTGDFLGCCGLRPYQADDLVFEIGFHLCPSAWGKGYAAEAANAAIYYAFTVLGADRVFAGHNPNNLASKKLLHKLGFDFIGEEFYPPTGLMHPSYEKRKPVQ